MKNTFFSIIAIFTMIVYSSCNPGAYGQPTPDQMPIPPDEIAPVLESVSPDYKYGIVRFADGSTETVMTLIPPAMGPNGPLDNGTAGTAISVVPLCRPSSVTTNNSGQSASSGFDWNPGMSASTGKAWILKTSYMQAANGLVLSFPVLTPVTGKFSPVPNPSQYVNTIWYPGWHHLGTMAMDTYGNYFHTL